MEIIIEKGCGLDVHKGTVVACIMGTGIKKEIRTYLTCGLVGVIRIPFSQDNFL
jgi:hypothetical protein